jgi:perosamine synthetase
MNNFIPVNTPLLNGNESLYLNECIATSWISSEGPFVDLFERNFANYVDRKFGVSVSNGTTALDLAINCLEIGPGDEVIVSSFTIISCINEILRVGAKPIFIDVDLYSFNILVDQVERQITPQTKAILITHIYGLAVDVDPILALAKKYNLYVIEDAAEVHGQEYKGKRCGQFGDISIFSFYSNKILTTGEGGMLLTNSERIAEKAKSLRNLCFDPNQRFVHKEIGWNMRMTNLQAALGVAQLENINDRIIRKRQIGALYNKLLSDIECIQLPLPRDDNSENIYWVYSIVLRDDKGLAAKIMSRLLQMGIGTRPFFYPLHLQPALAKYINDSSGLSCKNAEYLYRHGFYIPSGLGIKDIEIEVVADVLHKILK